MTMKWGVVCFLFFCCVSCETVKKLRISVLRDWAKVTRTTPHLPLSSKLNATELRHFILDEVNTVILNRTDYQLTRYLTIPVEDNSRNITLLTYEALLDSDVLFMSGGLDFLAQASVWPSLSGPTPVISVEPVHHWREDSRRLSHVLVPLFGQHFKGKAAVDLMKAKQGRNVERCAVIRGDVPSFELETFLEAQKAVSAQLHIPGQYSVSEFDYFNDFKALKSALKTLPSEAYFECFVIDCHLRFLDKLLPIMEAAFHEITAMVLLHDFLDVVHWVAESPAAHHLPDLTLVFYQNVFSPETDTSTGNDTDDSGPSSIYEAIEWDLIGRIATAAASFGYDSRDRTTNVIVLEEDRSKGCYNFSEILMPFLVDGRKLLEALNGTCDFGFSGKLALARGDSDNFPLDCLDESLVSFEVRKLNVSEIGGRTERTWTYFGNWTSKTGVSMVNPNWNLSPTYDLNENTTISVLVYRSPPFTFWNNATQQWDGMEVELMRTVARQLQLDVSFETGNTSLDSQSPQAIINDAIKNPPNYDLIIGGLPLVDKQSNLRSYHTTGVGILTKKAVEDDLNWWSFMDPFRWTVWLTTAGLLLVSMFVSKWLGLVKEYGDGLWLSLASVFFMNENKLVQMRNPFGRLYIVVLCFIFLALVSAYTANMISFLTSSRDQLYTAFSSLKGSAIPVGCPSHLADNLRFSAGIKRILPIDDEELALELLQNNTIVAYVDRKSSLEILAKRAYAECPFLLSTDLIFKEQIAPAFGSKAGTLLKQKVGEVLTQLISNRTAYILYDRYTDDGNSSRCPLTDVSGSVRKVEDPLRVSNLAGVFIVPVAAALLIAGILLIYMWSKHASTVQTVYPE
eukprot:m.220659 g.220659  ORF g.220659 m.220659 type:complete len:852 (+) comp39946_c0_seq2:3-2558(+)